MTIDCMIFTKDRSAQCELCLRSIRENFSEIKTIYVLYKASNDEFKKGYEKIIGVDKDIIWLAEDNFQNQTIKVINEYFKEPYCIFFADDEVIIRKPTLEILMPQFTDDVVSLNLRMSKDMTYCHSANLPMIIPKFIMTDPVLKWDWRKGDERVDWYYPASITCCIYRTNFIRRIWNSGPFKGPNALEGNLMNGNRNLMPPNMVSEHYAIILNVPNNMTQTAGYTPHGQRFEYSLEELNRKFLEGYKIDTGNLYGFNSKSVHTEVEYQLIKNTHE